jgi:hypothetical protein
LHIFPPLIGHVLKYGQFLKPIIEGCENYLTLDIYGTKQAHFISYFEGEKKKFQLG